MHTEWKTVPATMTLDMCVAFAEAWFSKVRCIDDPEMQDAYAAMIAAAPASAQPERDWEISCDHCNGSGYVFVERQVAERKSDVQEFKEECECCEGRGFNIAFEDIPGIADYVKSCRPASTAATEDAVKRLRDAIEGEWGGNWMSEKQAAAVLAHLGINAPAAGDALEWTLISDRLPEIPDGAPGKRIQILVGRHYEGRWFSWSLWYGPRGQDLRFYEEFADEDADGDDVELTKDDDCATHWRYMPAGPAIAQQKGEA